MDVAEVNQWRWIEESGQWLDNDIQTHLVLASGKPVLQKTDSSRFMESVGPADDDDSGEMANRGRLGHHARMMGPHGMGSHEGMMGRNNNQRNGKVIAEDGDTVEPLKTVIQPEVGVRGTLDSFPLPIFLIPHSISTYPT